MPDEKNPEDIESILSDLDAILTDMGGDKPAAAAPKPAEPPKPVEAPKPAPPPPPPPPPAPKPAAEPPKIELSPREGMIAPKPAAPPAAAAGAAASPPPPPAPIPTPPAPKAAEPPPPPAPKPAEPPKAAEPPKPAPAPAPPAPAAPTAAAPAAAAAGPDPTEIPANTPKEQIRRVAYVYAPAHAEAKKAFATFLSGAARTISKKPLFLREVLSLEAGEKGDPAAIVDKARGVKACAVLAVVEGWPPQKIDDLSEACSRASLLFRAVAPGDGTKKSTAVDIIVDMMLAPGEA